MRPAEITRLARRALALPPHVVAQKALAAARRRAAYVSERKRDAGRTTFCVDGPARVEQRLAAGFRAPAPSDERAVACRLYLEHRFDVLGSGWVDASWGVQAPGVEGVRYPAAPVPTVDAAGRWLGGRVTAPNLPEAQRRWRLVSDGYRPIDWRRDLRSGYRWPALTWFRDAVYGDVPAADVKVPWELARAHHLPQLALWAASLPADERDRVGREVCDQILDFSATNPPRFGCNWYVTMDVGIRIANWCLAIDLVRAAGFELDKEVEAALARAIHEHGEFIAGNLEWFPDMRSNHYLGNLLGLAFAAAYLPASPEADSWASFAAAALVEESVRQWCADGGNFEGSTAYHRLSTELLLWGVAVLRALPAERAASLGAWDAAHVEVAQPPVPVDSAALAAPELDALFVRAARFALDATRPDGRLVQFGDCDSGRALKLAPGLRMLPVDEWRGLFENLAGWEPPAGAPGALPLEEHLDARHLASVAGALAGDRALSARGDAPVDEAVVSALLAGGAGAAARARRDAPPALPADPADVRVGSDEVFAEACVAGGDVLRRAFPAPVGYLDDLETAAYPEFGLWVFRSRALWLAVRCGSVGQYGAGGHAHNDQLAIELWLDGRPVVLDPGTYAYTHLPARRNEYRTVAAHDAPRLGLREPALLTHGLFQLEGARPGTCAYFGPRGFAGTHDGYGVDVVRAIELTPHEVVVTDRAPAGVAIDVAAAVPPYSPGYGVRLRDGALERFVGLGAAVGAEAPAASGPAARPSGEAPR